MFALPIGKWCMGSGGLADGMQSTSEYARVRRVIIVLERVMKSSSTVLYYPGAPTNFAKLRNLHVYLCEAPYNRQFSN